MPSFMCSDGCLSAHTAPVWATLPMWLISYFTAFPTRTVTQNPASSPWFQTVVDPSATGCASRPRTSSALTQASAPADPAQTPGGEPQTVPLATQRTTQNRPGRPQSAVRQPRPDPRHPANGCGGLWSLARTGRRTPYRAAVTNPSRRRWGPGELPAPLPRTLIPLPEESLTGYLLRGSYRLGQSPLRFAQPWA